MSTERWARVPDSPYGVEVSDRGRVRRHGVILPPSPARRPAVNIGPQRPRAIQYLVLEAFVGPRPKGYVCCHRNDDSRDNRLANLYWGTYSDNARDKVANGLDPDASKTHCNNGHEFTPDNIYTLTTGGRGCRECRRINAAAYRDRTPEGAKGTCGFTGCDNWVRAKGLCSAHWKQQHDGKPLRPVRPWSPGRPKRVAA